MVFTFDLELQALSAHDEKSSKYLEFVLRVNYTSQTTFLDLENTQLHCKTGRRQEGKKEETTKKAAPVCEWVEEVCADV